MKKPSGRGFTYQEMSRDEFLEHIKSVLMGVKARIAHEQGIAPMSPITKYTWLSVQHMLIHQPTHAKDPEVQAVVNEICVRVKMYLTSRGIEL